MIWCFIRIEREYVVVGEARAPDGLRAGVLNSH